MNVTRIAGVSLMCLGLAAVVPGGCAQTDGGNGQTGGAGGSTGGRGGSGGAGGRGGSGTGGSAPATGGSGAGGTGTGGTGTGGAAGGSGGAAGGSGGAAGGSGGAAGGSGGSGAGGTGTGGAGTGGSGGAGGTGMVPAFSPKPFPAHTKYAAGVILPSGGQAQLDMATRQFYDRWKAAYFKQLCGGWYVHTGVPYGTPPGTVTVSEGHGYGMIIAAMMSGHDPQARAIFDGLHTFAKKFESINKTGLMAWLVLDTCRLPTAVTGDHVPDSAADGDLDMAFAYLLAHAQWGSTGPINYFEEAQKMLASIKTHLINPQTKLIMMGDWADIMAPYYPTRYMTGFQGPYRNNSQPHSAYYWGTRSSDFMLDHYRAFGVASDAGFWTSVLDKHYELIARIQSQFSQQSGLLPDFIEKTNTGAVPAMANYLEYVNDGFHAYNACRVPWRLGTDYVLSGDPRGKAALQKINSFIKGATGSDPAQVKAGYRLDGSVVGNYEDLVFTTPFGVAAMADASNQAWLDAMWRYVVGKPNAGYYADSIKMLSMLVMSGNWWSPGP